MLSEKMSVVMKMPLFQIQQSLYLAIAYAMALMSLETSSGNVTVVKGSSVLITVRGNASSSSVGASGLENS